MRVAVCYVPRRVSYDADWLDAFREAFDTNLIDLRAAEPGAATKAIAGADLVALMHSTNEQVPDLPAWVSAAVKDRRGRAMWFMANEFRDFKAKRAACAEHNIDWIASMLPLGVARTFYGEKAVAMPHALNDNAFRCDVPRHKRQYRLGYRGTTYPTGLGDDDRRRIIGLASRVLGADVREGGKYFQCRSDWAAALNNWRATVATESGMAGAKCISSRHFDAIGTKTVQIMPRGRFNGILTDDHYVPCEPTETGVTQALAIAEADGDKIAETSLAHVIESHTYRHRMADIEMLIC
ncbi:MAG: hypothetical protein O3A21_07020 [Proteobacteria bacterium]|nr:hypothetical protein [Pseudomonadota bacterium]